MDDWAPHGARQDLLGQVIGSVLGESEPPPVVSESGLGLCCSLEGHPTADGVPGSRHCVLFSQGPPCCSVSLGTCELDTQHYLSGLAGAFPAPWPLRGAAQPSQALGSPGASWRNRLSLQALGLLPSLAQPQISLPALEPSTGQAQLAKPRPGGVHGRAVESLH